MNNYPEWFNNKLLDIYFKKRDYILKQKKSNGKAAIYYERKHLQIYIPSIIITGISSIFSFIVSSNKFDINILFSLNLTIGVLSSIATILQTIASVTNNSMKANMHKEAYENYDKLLTKIEFEICMPNEEHFLDKLEEQILDIQNKCKNPIPQFISNKYDNKLYINYDNFNDNEIINIQN